MSTIYSPNTVMVEMIHLHGSNRVENVYHVQMPNAPTAGDLTAIFNVFDNWERNTARLHRINLTSWVAYSLTSIHAAGQPFLAGSVLPAAVGGALNGQGYPSVTVAIKFATGLSGRSYRGRAYWIGLPVNEVDTNGLIVASRVTAIIAAYNTLKAALTTAGYTLVVCSKYSGVDYSTGRRKAIPRATGLNTPVTSITADNYVDSQRRRLIRPTT